MRAGPEGAFVLDNSVVMPWAFEDEDDPYALGILRAMPAWTAVVPPLWMWEVANGLLTGVRRGRLSEESARSFLTELSRMAIEPAAPRSLMGIPALFTAAHEERLTAYDAEYLFLALETGLPLATSDRALLAAMERVGVERFTA